MGHKSTSISAQAWRAALLLAQVIWIRVSTAWLLPRRDRTRRWQHAQRWAVRMLDALNVRVIVSGYPPQKDAAILLVANHISWLDIQALSTVSAARFVAKSEVRHWFLVGRTAQYLETFFIKRGSCRDAWRTKNDLAVALKAGDLVAVFPEGTTTDGQRVQPFHPALFQAAIDTRVAVCPVTIRYETLAGAGNAAAVFLDGENFVKSLLRILREPLMAVELSFGKPISSRNRTRRELAALAQLMISETLSHAPRHHLLEALRATWGARQRPKLGSGGLPEARAPAVA